ncbi:carbonic anhydrase/acetyltransferase-like protein (isoleucine patch superfamily) [Arcticibacter tournemirensis]|uniref:Gamma carbonic anhydrase family protein n=1 Tax=Arcticibacter tournemirensis TaxID=699437 RepID=A0A4V1KIU3_9SPHI|nr:gamma carbonic anhydrase family protein [Arcticibacter tournemirensis]KAA8479120.1 gamma carbonic anhydrase family protein [Arcticibacter tournemirensis]RXF71892.1 gamma carbonic anhydrase family protein [Arcticibacter tournemirensis]TQM48625.1 carbonic anhydrase/acetyltransferase-like protein (isoleucine patch superfamily) [Arcticibacter tournemirensis]
MPLILSVKGKFPIFGRDCFIAENATVVGEVEMGNNCSVWFNAVVRGDVNYIKIGDNVNIQDGVVIHCTYQRAPTIIGNDVSIGHNALVHGCTLKNNVLIGMGSIVMDHAVIEEFCIIAAGSVVLENTICESGYIYAGTPARKIKAVSEEQRAMLKKLPQNYIMYSQWFTEPGEGSSASLQDPS